MLKIDQEAFDEIVNQLDLNEMETSLETNNDLKKAGVDREKISKAEEIVLEKFGIQKLAAATKKIMKLHSPLMNGKGFINHLKEKDFSDDPAALDLLQAYLDNEEMFNSMTPAQLTSFVNSINVQ